MKNKNTLDEGWAPPQMVVTRCLNSGTAPQGATLTAQGAAHASLLCAGYVCHARWLTHKMRDVTRTNCVPCASRERDVCAGAHPMMAARACVCMVHGTRTDEKIFL